MGPSPSEQFSVSFPSVSKLSNNRRFTFHKKDGTLEIEGFSRSIASQQICFIYVTGFLLSNVATIKAKIVQVHGCNVEKSIALVAKVTTIWNNLGSFIKRRI